MGFRKVSERVRGQTVFTDGKKFITRNVDGHQGGAWKVADSIRALAKKETRSGTFSPDLSKRIGD
jgi:filamentous hemagglutinin